MDSQKSKKLKVNENQMIFIYFIKGELVFLRFLNNMSLRRM